MPVRLPKAGRDNVPAPAHSTELSSRVGGTPGVAISFAFMSGFRRMGNWVVPKRHSAFAIMGGVEIIVPDDVTVRVQGVGVMGGFNHAASHEGPPDAPVVRINGFAFWGGAEVKRRNRKQRGALETGN
ncbi:MAG TPA: hypothetical protein VFO16_23790 [Pseudonocardiaceae bacterium]|nr:hypothetical protein [Pseudonocardiaceae bacterium]